MPFTNICSFTLFESLITNDLPFADTNSLATLANALAAFSFKLGADTEGVPVKAATSLYNLAIAAPCSLGFTNMRLSAFEPVIDK